MRSHLLRRAALVLGGLVLLILLILAALLQSPDNEVLHSAQSSDTRGWRALHLLFEDLGMRSELWTADLAALPTGRHVLWWGDAPLHARNESPDVGEGDAEDDQAADAEPAAIADTAREPDALDRLLADGPRAARHLRRFLAQGGRLVASPSEDVRAWLEREAGLYELEGTRFETVECAAGSLRGPGGERLDLVLPRVQRLQGLDPALVVEVLLHDGAGAALLFEVPIGRGGLVFLPDDTLLDNASIDGQDAALLAVRLAEWLAPGGRQLFDEGLLGLGPSSGPASLALGADLRLLSVHLVLLALLGLWYASWPREFPRDPQAPQQVAPLERARAGASLARRAGRIGVLAGVLRRATLTRSARRLRVDLPAEPDLDADLRALAAAAGERFDAARWRRALAGPEPRDPDELAQLDGELRALEARLSHGDGARRTHSATTTAGESA